MVSAAATSTRPNESAAALDANLFEHGTLARPADRDIEVDPWHGTPSSRATAPGRSRPGRPRGIFTNTRPVPGNSTVDGQRWPWSSSAEVS